MKKIIDILREVHPNENFEASDDFISDGLLDSFDLQDLFARLEEEYGIELAGTDLAPQNFQTIESIKDLLESRGVDVSNL
ncbi:MAG: acyl carrier protein [Selenomonadaceae bacterium]|nr:acyl carrier protein [Selenomonadaceae bacterium]